MANIRISDLTSEDDLGKIVGLVGYVNTTTQGVYNTVKITGDPLNSSKNFVVYDNSADITASPLANVHRTELNKDGVKTFGSNLELESTSLANIKGYGGSFISDGGYNIATDAITIATFNDSGNKGAISISSNGGHQDNKGIKLRSATNIQIDLHSITANQTAAPIVGQALVAKDTDGNLKWASAGGAQKFVINLRIGFEEGTTTVPTRLMSWNGNVELSGGTSEDGGSYYVNDAFKINKAILRYAGANAIAMSGTDAMTFELAYLTPSSTNPNSWSAVGNSGSSDSTSISDFNTDLDLSIADNATFPWKTFTPTTPISISADTMLIMKAVEESSITPSNADLFIQLYCEYA